MEEFTRFLKAVLSHWGWLTAAVIALILSAKMDFGEDYKPRIALVIAAIGCVIVAVYLALDEQYRALNQFLRPG